MSELREVGDAVIGEKLAAIGRKMSRVFVVSGTSSHRAQTVHVWGKPARCFVDVPLRLRP